MQVNKDLISRLEKLARLRLSPEEQNKFAGDLTQILEMVDTLLELDTTGVAPLVYPTEGTDHWRDDEVGAQLSQAEALQNAPQHDGAFFRVPKVIE